MDYKEKVIELLKSKVISKEEKEKLADIFPELKESEDERIRKELLNYLYDSHDDDEERARWIAWLEKQGEKEKFIKKELECIRGYRDEAIRRLNELEKQGEQKPYGQRKECKDCQMNYAGECKGSCQMKRDEQKPADEVEPKFKVGDIVQYITDSTDRRRIDEIDEFCNMYITNGSPIMFEVEDEWTVVVKAEDVESVPLTGFQKTLADICRGWIGEEPGWEDYIIKNSIPLLKLAQKQWKPSEDQMDALAEALSLAKNCGEECAFDLRTLYEQLKKLREE